MGEKSTLIAIWIMFIGLTNLVPSPFQRLGVKPTYLSLTLAPSPLDHEFKKQWLVKF
jgi:hypothetical protein